MPDFKIGVHIRPQHTSVAALRAAWKGADALGVDSISIWDHFYPLDRRPGRYHFECWTLSGGDGLRYTAGADRRDRVRDRLSQSGPAGGHGAHRRPSQRWTAVPRPRRRQLRAYTRSSATRGALAGERLRALREGIGRIKARLPKLNPPPVGRLPLLVAGGGERVTLRLVAEFADMSNTPGPPDVLRHKNQVIDDWCAQVGRVAEGHRADDEYRRRGGRAHPRVRRGRRAATADSTGPSIRPEAGRDRAALARIATFTGSELTNGVRTQG